MSKANKSTIGGQLREFREAAELTQGELAERAGLSQQHVSELERDRLRPTVDTLCRLAKALQIRAEPGGLIVQWGHDGDRIVFGRRKL